MNVCDECVLMSNLSQNKCKNTIISKKLCLWIYKNNRFIGYGLEWKKWVRSIDELEVLIINKNMSKYK